MAMGGIMGFFDDVQGTLDRGMTMARGAVSTVAGEQLGFVRGFGRMCQDGWALGYHERNGGNASYRLTASDIASVQSFFYDTPSSWVPLGVTVPEMAGEHLLVTGSGKFLRNVQSDPVTNAGIVEIGPQGDVWRIVWGLKDGGRPTSEIGAHVAAHGVRKGVTGGQARVLYHAHPNAVIALTTLVPADARTLTRLLWSTVTESVIAFPGGVGALEWKVPGSADLAQATARIMRDYEACVWQLHGVFASGADFDAAFGLVNAIDKAADVYVRARAAQGGKENLPYAISDADLRATALAYNLPINEGFLS